MKPPTLIFVAVSLLFASLIGVYRDYHDRVNRKLGPHHLGHPVIDKANFLSEDIARRLRELAHTVGAIPSSQREGAAMKLLAEHIGEAVPFNGKKCPDPLLVPNSARDKCVFAQRVDVGRHYIMSGGPEGLKETYDSLVDRVQSFLTYLFDYQKYPVAKELLESDDFDRLAKAVCPPQQQHLDPVQLNIVVNVPGQTVATHIDAPYFWGGGNRFRVPIWLLASMVFSGLFKEQFVHQVQVVGYFHDWGTMTAEEEAKRAGRFVWWDRETSSPDSKIIAKYADPLPRSANSMDGSKIVHAAGVYYPTQSPPRLEPSAANELVWDASIEKWHVKSNGKIARTYNETELRFSVVYRARCFADQAQRNQYHELDALAMKASEKGEVPTDPRILTIEGILERFREDLVRRGEYPSLEEARKVRPYDFGIKILDYYSPYPYSETAKFPLNYCALMRLWPWTKSILSFFCTR